MPDINNIRDMQRIVHWVSGTEKKQVQIIAHEVRKEFEYIDYYDLFEAVPRHSHRIRKLNDVWKVVY